MGLIYNKSELFFYLINQDVRKAIDYISLFPEKIKLLKKYQKVFDKRVVRPKKINNLIDETILSYNYYYIDSLYLKLKEEECLKSLVERLSKLYDYNISYEITYEYILQELEKIIEIKLKEYGYYFLGGDISNIYGPYIWKDSFIKWFKVDLPNESINLKITFCDKFISKSWLDFISFSKINLEYWYSSNNSLFCNYKIYKNKLNKPKFQITFLKRNAMQLIDIHKYGKMMNKDFEYRLILIELIYYPNISKFKQVLNCAFKNNKENHITYASYIVVSNLSKIIFNTNFITDIDLWKGKVKLVQENSLILLNKHTQDIRSSLSEVIDII